MESARAWVVLALVAVSATALVAAGVADGAKTKRVKTKLVKTEIGPNGASGVVKSKQKACRKKRKVILRGPEPFKPRAGAEAAAPVPYPKIDSDKTNRKGRWMISPPKGGFFVAGDYKVQVKRSKVKTKNGKGDDLTILCLAAHVTKKA